MAGAAGRAAAAGIGGFGAAGFGAGGGAGLAACGGATGAGAGAGAGGRRRNASLRIRLVVIGVTNLAAPFASRNLESAMIIARPSNSFKGERAGRNAAERPSPMTTK